MKKSLLLIALILSSSLAFAAAPELEYVEASTLTMVGKLFPDTPNPYHRVDTVAYKGFTPAENKQVRMSSGIAVAFTTNSKVIKVKMDFASDNIGNNWNTGGGAARGTDLYIKDKNGEWLWAGCSGCVYDANNLKVLYDPRTVVAGMDGSVHECLLYLPLFSEESSVKIGIEKGSYIKASPNPFRYRIAIFGSSFTHGASCSRPGMTYPAQFCRMTGLQLLSLGCSGNSKLQPYFADALKDAPVDAFIFDAFSNPDSQQIKERLFPFIEKIQANNPGKPIIFQRTIYRESRNFNLHNEKVQSDRIRTADSLMNIACENFKDVYYIKTNATGKTHETSVDGTHPGDYGYTLWAESIAGPVMKILKKYGIK